MKNLEKWSLILTSGVLGDKGNSSYLSATESIIPPIGQHKAICHEFVLFEAPPSDHFAEIFCRTDVSKCNHSLILLSSGSFAVLS